MIWISAFLPIRLASLASTTSPLNEAVLSTVKNSETKRTVATPFCTVTLCSPKLPKVVVKATSTSSAEVSRLPKASFNEKVTSVLEAPSAFNTPSSSL